MEERKHIAIIGGILLIVGLVFGLPYLNWFRFEMVARDSMSDKGVGRFPDAQKIVDVRDAIKADAKAKGFEGLEVEMRLYERKMPPTTMWFLNVKMIHGTRTFVQERRIESKFGAEDAEFLREHGCAVESLKEGQEEEDDEESAEDE
jgi:hypothetical protein